MTFNYTVARTESQGTYDGDLLAQRGFDRALTPPRSVSCVTSSSLSKIRQWRRRRANHAWRQEGDRAVEFGSKLRIDGDCAIHDAIGDVPELGLQAPGRAHKGTRHRGDEARGRIH